VTDPIEPTPPAPGNAAAPADVEAPRKRPLVSRVARYALTGLLALVILGMALWATLAIDLADLSVRSPRHIRAALFCLATIAALTFIRPRKYVLLVFLLLFAGVLVWFLTLKASNERDWAPDVARAPTIDVAGDRMTVHNLRNFDYRSETDFTPRWEDRTYDLSHLRGADFMLVYWGSKAIAHGMVAFDFDNDDYLCVSIETRKEKHETYSALEGFFRQYELIYIFADERDLVRLRTNFRHEDVYLYRTNIRPEAARAILMEYVRNADALAKQPEFYNALTSNCVTNVVYNTRTVNPSARITWETILSGYAARQAYRNGRLDRRLPFEELEKRCHINDAAIAAGDGTDFSRKIRVGLPVPVPESR
jgi:hypothetical protein